MNFVKSRIGIPFKLALVGQFGHLHKSLDSFHSSLRATRPHKRTKYYANVIDYFRYIKILTWLQGRAVRKQKKCIIHY